jgi:hypothetical protein
MIGISDEELVRQRPKVGAEKAIGYCLRCLIDDKIHGISDEVSPDLSYEELIGALLIARDNIRGGV